MNIVLKEDLNNIMNSAYINWEKYKYCSFLITGATGLVGSLLVRTLAHVSEQKNLHYRVLILVRDLKKARHIFGQDFDQKCIIPVSGDIRNPIEIPERVDYIFHAAAVTDSKQMVDSPISTFLTSVDGTKNLLDFADRVNVKGMVYISSMEMYGITREEDNPVFEDCLGYLDLTNVRSSYQEGKRAAEFLCMAYHSEKNVPVKTARLAQTFGAGVSKSDKRVFAQFARSVVNHKDIVLHTRGQSMGNYCYTTDMIKGLFCILERGQDGQAYNVVNESNTMTIKDMARLVSEGLTDGQLRVIYDIPESDLVYGYAPEVRMRLSGKKLRRLGWRPETGIIDMYKRMMKYWKSEI